MWLGPLQREMVLIELCLQIIRVRWGSYARVIVIKDQNNS